MSREALTPEGNDLLLPVRKEPGHATDGRYL